MTNKNSNKALTTMTQMFGTQGSPNTFWFQTPKSLDIVTWDPTTDAFTNQNMADIFTQSTLLELGIMPDVLTTAGDLVYYNGITTKPTRFPIGTQGTFLMSNNSGLGSTPGWKNPGPAVNTSVNTTTNQWYTGPTTAGLSTLVLTANELYAIPIFIAQPHVINGIGVHFTSASTGTVRCGIYNDNILNPLSLLKDSGNMAVGSTSTFLSTTFSTSLTISSPQWIWLAMVSDTAFTVSAIANLAGTALGYTIGSGNVNASIGTKYSFTFGALPSTWGGTTNTYPGASQPAVFISFAS